MSENPRFLKWNIKQQIEKALLPVNNKNITIWQNIITELPALKPSVVDLISGVTIGCNEDINKQQKENIKKLLQQFHPWRKGPFSIFDILIDTEWCSDWKWDRLKKHIAPLKDRIVLDVGCGNGYHCWRMIGENAKYALGIDPTILYTMQYQAFAKYLPKHPAFVVPLKIEDVPENLETFDTVFSMGILYHRRSPIDHLYNLKGCLRSGGELILETLVIDGKKGEILLPEGRYAKMRNVWFLPTCLTLESWLKRCGFVNIKLIDVNQTQITEQRSTSWMTFESLENFLSSKNQKITVEGLPAPKRAIFIANKK